jgi:hypothetical protein
VIVRLTTRFFSLAVATLVLTLAKSSAAQAPAAPSEPAVSVTPPRLV